MRDRKWRLQFGNCIKLSDWEYGGIECVGDAAARFQEIVPCFQVYTRKTLKEFEEKLRHSLAEDLRDTNFLSRGWSVRCVAIERWKTTGVDRCKRCGKFCYPDAEFDFPRQGDAAERHFTSF